MEDSLTKFDFLKKVPIFKGLNESQVEKISQSLKSASYKEGEYITRENEEGDRLFILYKGRVKIAKCLTMLAKAESCDEFDKSLNILDGNNHPTFGELALIDGGLRSATATALTECHLLTLSRDSFERLIQSDPLMGYILMKNIAVNIADMLKKSSQDVLKLATAFSLAMKCER